MVAAFDTGQVDDVEEYVGSDYIDHQNLSGEHIRGAVGFVHVVEVARGGYEDLSVTVEDLIVDGDRAAGRLRWTRTRETGDVVERETVEIVYVRDGRAVAHWGGRS